MTKITFRLKGGQGSGFTSEGGHKGIPGKQGGSQPAESDITYDAEAHKRNVEKRRQNREFVNAVTGGGKVIASKPAGKQPPKNDYGIPKTEIVSKLEEWIFDHLDEISDEDGNLNSSSDEKLMNAVYDVADGYSQIEDQGKLPDKWFDEYTQEALRNVSESGAVNLNITEG